MSSVTIFDVVSVVPSDVWIASGLTLAAGAAGVVWIFDPTSWWRATFTGVLASSAIWAMYHAQASI